MSVSVYLSLHIFKGVFLWKELSEMEMFGQRIQSVSVLNTYRLSIPNRKIQNLKCFKIRNFFRAGVVPQVENSISDLMWQGAVKM
jgi:hypothetical protein